MTGFEIRAQAPEDAERVATLMNEAAAGTGAERPPVYDPADIRDWSKLDDRAWLAFADGELAGHAAVLFRVPTRADAFVCVHPRFRGRGLASRLVELTEARSRERGAGAIQQLAPALDRDGRRLLESLGYRRVRSFVEMSVALDGDEPEPEVPFGIELTRIAPELERAVHAAINDAFSDDWGFVARPFEEWRKHRIESESFDPGLWIVALDGEDVAGVAVCAVRGGIGYVNNLAVRAPWRRRGLGLALLRESARELARRGERRVGLNVDAENSTGATRLYERAGMEVDWQEDVYEKELGDA